MRPMIKIARKYGTINLGPHKFHIIPQETASTAVTMVHCPYRTQIMPCRWGSPMLEGFTYAEYNDLASFEAAITDNTIAIMVETCQGEGGVVPATREFMTGLRKLCDERGLLLLLDEVQTGW